MLGYIKALASRARLIAEEAGQNLVETALIIGVVSVVLVGAMNVANVSAAVGELADRVMCEAAGDTWAQTAGRGGDCTDG